MGLRQKTLEFNIHKDILLKHNFLSLKLPWFLPNITKLRLICLQVSLVSRNLAWLFTFVVIIQSLCVWLFETAWTAELQTSLSFTISWSLLKLTSIELVMPSNHLILCLPFLLLPSIFPSIRAFPKKLALHIRCPTYRSFSIGSSNEYSGLISFGTDWFDK